MKYHKVNGAKLTPKQFNWLKKKAGKKGFTSKEASKLLTKAMSTPKMGVTKNKMYKYPSTPVMGKAGGKGTTLSLFGAIGSAGQKLANQDRANVKTASDRMEKPGMRRTGKGSYEFNNPEDKANKTAELLNTAQSSLFSRNTSVPAMGPIGAVVGASGGSKLGSFVGSAGKLIGKKHEKYGRLAGEYIGGSLGGVFGGLLSPI